MSVMEKMRAGTDSTFMQIVFAAVVVSFVGWGVGINGNTTSTVATVNGEGITALEFGSVYRRAEQQYSSRSTEGLSEDDREQLRDQVLQEMIRNTALVQEAKALGLEVSNTEIAEELYEYTFLLDEDGMFDKRAYQNFLRRQGLTRANFEEQLREQLVIRKLKGLMILGASVSDPMVKQQWADDNTKLDISFVRITPGTFSQQIRPTDAELDAWIADHGSEIQSRYDEQLSSAYDQPETVDVSLIRLAVRDDGLGPADLKPRMEALVAELQGGADWAALARRWSEDPSASQGGVLTALPVTTLDAKVAEALTGLEPGQISDVLVSDRDVRLYRLDARTAARTIPLEEVQRDIGLTLYREIEGPSRAAAFAEKELLPAWTDAAAPPEELLAAQKLRVSTTGLVPSSGGSGLLRPPDAMMKAAREADAGTVLPEVYEDNGVLWVGALTQREDPDFEAYEEDKETIREQVLLTRRIAFFQGWEDDVVARADVKK